MPIVVVDVWLPSLWEGEDLEFHIILVLSLQANKQTKQQNKTKEKKPKKQTTIKKPWNMLLRCLKQVQGIAQFYETLARGCRIPKQAQIRERRGGEEKQSPILLVRVCCMNVFCLMWPF